LASINRNSLSDRRRAAKRGRAHKAATDRYPPIAGGGLSNDLVMQPLMSPVIAGAMDCLRNPSADHRHDLTVLTPGTAGHDEEAAAGGSRRAAKLRAAKAYIVGNSSRRGVSVATVAAHLGLTPRSLQRLFEADGSTFSAFLLAQRLTRAYRMLRDPQFSDFPVSSIAYDAGFGDLSYFNRCFRRLYGATPKAIRQAGSRQHEEFDVAVDA
jgi:AraC-like DNA-binding protein